MTANEKIQNALQQAKADSQADLEDIDAGIQALKNEVAAQADADVARIREAKKQYDNTLGVFVDEPDAGGIGPN